MKNSECQDDYSYKQLPRYLNVTIKQLH